MNNHGGFRVGAGRPRGSRNRLLESRERLLAQFAAKGFDPVETLIEIAQHSATDPKLRANIAKELLNYVAPRQKASEMRIEENREVIIVLNKDVPDDPVVCSGRVDHVPALAIKPTNY